MAPSEDVNVCASHILIDIVILVVVPLFVLLAKEPMWGDDKNAYYLDTKLISKCVNSITLTVLPHVATSLMCYTTCVQRCLTLFTRQIGGIELKSVFTILNFLAYRHY